MSQSSSGMRVSGTSGFGPVPSTRRHTAATRLSVSIRTVAAAAVMALAGKCACETMMKIEPAHRTTKSTRAVHPMQTRRRDQDRIWRLFSSNASRSWRSCSSARAFVLVTDARGETPRCREATRLDDRDIASSVAARGVVAVASDVRSLIACPSAGRGRDRRPRRGRRSARTTACVHRCPGAPEEARLQRTREVGPEPGCSPA